MSVRGPELARLLLSLGGVSSALLISVGCSCDFTEVRGIDPATYDALHARYGSALIESEEVCAPLCGTATATEDTGTYSSIATRSCRLVRIDWQRPGVQCELTELDCGIGRRPAGLQPLEGPKWSRVACLEAASVVAFLRLAADLERHGAPAGLVDGARRAAADEDRHARLTAGLARRAGVEPPPATVRPVAPRPLVDIAIENASEGCVGEALGAVEAAWASVHDPDPEVRRVMAEVAVDEAGHAALSYAIDDWVRTRLGTGEQVRVDAARRRAQERFGTTPQRRRWLIQLVRQAAA